MVTDFFGAMTPSVAQQVRAYMAVYLGNGIEIGAGKDTVFAVGRQREDEVPLEFVLALSNPKRPEHGNGGTLIVSDWRTGLAVSGFKDENPKSTCAEAFKDLRGVMRRFEDEGNDRLDDEAQVLVVPVLWREGDGSEAIAVLGLSAETQEAFTAAQDLRRRLKLTANALGVAIQRLAQEVTPERLQPFGIDRGGSSAVSFERRAIQLRKLVARVAIEDLIDTERLRLEVVAGAMVLVGPNTGTEGNQ